MTQPFGRAGRSQPRAARRGITAQQVRRGTIQTVLRGMGLCSCQSLHRFTRFTRVGRLGGVFSWPAQGCSAPE